MTKKVRVENADTSNYKVVVQVWTKNTTGGSDVMREERILQNPTDLFDFFIWQEQYLIIKEKL